MTRAPRRARAVTTSRRDPMDYFHDEWLGMVRPIDGLVVAKQALLDAQVARPEGSRAVRDALEGLLAPLPADPGAGQLAVTDVTRLYEDVLGLGPERWLAGDQLGEAFSLALPDTGQVLRPTRVLVRGADTPPVALAWDLPPGLPFDERETITGAWDYPPGAKLDRLLRHTGVPIGLLTNGTHLRLMYAPHGASTGAMTFRFADMVTAAGKPLLDALVMLLHARQWFSVPPDKQLPRLLAASREAQGRVTKELADQVLEALHILLAGFEAADGGAALNAAYRDPDRGGEHIYAGLLTFMLRLVFVLYAEDNGLLPVDHPLYSQHLSVLGLHDELAADAGAYPDAMARRYGAYGRLIAVFRAIFFGVAHGTLQMPPRHGELFSPHLYPFLEGVDEPASPGLNDSDGRRRVNLPAIDDETVYRVLHRLLVLGEERLSYKALDVEQIGSVYEALMGFSVEQLTAPAVCLKKSRTWLTGEQLAAEPVAARGKWLADELGLAKADSDRIAKAVGNTHKPSAILDALAPFATTTPPRSDAGRYIIQPGAERRRSGSHYTPRSLTGPIVQKTLAPLLTALGDAPTSEQLLSLKICDPAMGSGAFLVETVRQLGDHIVAAWRREGVRSGLLPAHGPAHATEDAVPLARRLVAQRCIYGVDKNPHAVTLAKLSLWLVTLAKEKPFTFVDHALRHGDSLVGLDLDQITAFHWEPDAQIDVVERELRQVLDEAVASRERIVALAVDDSPAAQREKERLLRDANDAVGRLRLIGDLVLGAFFSSTKPKEREAERVRRRDLVAAWLASDRDTVPSEVAALAADFRAQIPAFHWMIELPEVFWAKRKNPLNGALDGRAWVDGFVSNPPFLGGVRISTVNGEAYKEWLSFAHPTSGHTDLSVYFIRRCFMLLGDMGTLGMIATNSISQGDNKLSGLAWALEKGATIYSAVRSRPWPGDAAVSVSVVHLGLRMLTGRPSLDDREVDRIGASFSTRTNDGQPHQLRANQGLSAIGSYVLGIGFVFDDANPGATPLEVARRLIAQDARNSERILSYLSGEDLTTNPDQSSNRLVIDFGDLEEADAKRWPELYAIVREKVRPARASVKQRDRREEWWRHATRSPVLRAYFNSKKRALAISQVTTHLAFTFVPRSTVLSHTCVAFLFDGETQFGILQSRIHRAWAGQHGSSLETRMRYTPTECFETFPFPDPDPSKRIAAIEEIGRQLYERRTRLMAVSRQGLTDTYNQLTDPDCQSSRIAEVEELRVLHEELDRAVLAAYGWSDIPVPPYCPTTDAERAALALFDDQVIDRLLALNAERAVAEAKAAGKAVPTATKSRIAKPPKKPRGPKAQTSMLDDK